MNELVKEQVYMVNTWETDTLGRVSVPTIFNWLQDIAANHATDLHFGKEDMAKNNLFWVLSRIYCTVESLPKLGDDIRVRTWTRGIDSIFALRDFEFSMNGKRIGGATSSWLILDTENHRPVRPDKFEFLVNRDHEKRMALDRNAEKIESDRDYHYISPVTSVRYSNLDVNNHVNNVMYLRWTLDSYPMEYLINHSIVSAELNFMRESVSGDEITVATCETGDKRFIHSIRRKSDGNEQCRVRLAWND